MKNNSRKLIIVQSTDSPVMLMMQKGIWARQSFSLEQYARRFDVEYYTSDAVSCVHLMPKGVRHRRPRFLTGLFGIDHVLYYFYLMVAAARWRFMSRVTVRVVGVNIPVVPIIRFVSGKKFIVSYQFDWAEGMKLDYKGIKPLVSGAVQRLAIKSADHLLCTTQWLKEIAITRYHFPEKRITINPNYVNTDVFKPIYPKKRQIAFAGRLHWSKGVDTLIKAFLEFERLRPGYQLVIMGGGDGESQIRSVAGDAKSVVFLGNVSNIRVAEVLGESEMFVLPTVNMEGHPKALVEAMAAGCKSIASDVKGNNNVLRDSGAEDFLFPSTDVAALTRTLLYASEKETNSQLTFALQNYSHGMCFSRELDLLELYSS